MKFLREPQEPEYQGHTQVEGQGHMCVSCLHDTAWTSWHAFTKCYGVPR